MTLDDLYATIQSRRSADPDSSWTAQLLGKGPEKCAEKFGEEAIEAIIEAVKGDKAALTSEAADVLYHLMVMLVSCDVPAGVANCGNGRDYHPRCLSGCDPSSQTKLIC